MTRLQSLQQSFQTGLRQLSNIKFDAATISSIQLTLNDPDFLAKLGSNAKEYFDTALGRMTISIGLSSLTLAVCFPLQFEALKSNIALRNKYEQDTNRLPALESNMVAVRLNQRSLKAKKEISDQYLQNSLRILFLPEVIRAAAAGQQIELLSFRPETSDSLNETSPVPNPSSVDQNSQSRPSPPQQSQPNGASTSPTKSFSSTGYSLLVRGDYLKMLNFLRELQSFKSYLTFKTSKFTATSAVSTASDSAAAAAPSSTGEVVLDLILEVPTQNYGGFSGQPAPPNLPPAN